MTLQKNTIKLISFDLDNALYDNTPVLARAEGVIKAYLKEAFQKQDKLFDYDEYLSIRQSLLNQKNPIYDDVGLLRKTALEEFCKNLSNKESIIDEALTLFLAARSDVTILPTMQAMLVELSKKYVLVTITNGNCEIQKNSIAHVFKKHYSPTMGYRAKPNPEMLNKAMTDFNVTPREILHVGDSIEMDGGGASNAGANFHYFAPFETGASVESSCNQLLQLLA